jgi:butyrate kinase
MTRILAINPGATSTKFAVFDDEQIVFKKNIEHQGCDLGAFVSVYDQQEYRLELIVTEMTEAGILLDTLQAVVGRGGLLKPLAGGTYIVNDLMVEDLKKAEYGEHASNLGAVLADRLAKLLHIPAFIVDPVTVDELQPVARISGSPEFVRISMSHALNMKAMAHKAAQDMGKSYKDTKLIVAHLGTGISLSVHRNGKMIDIIDGRDEGPFAPDRSGGLPTVQLVRLCYSGKYSYQDMQKKMFGSGGLHAYLGTKDIRQIEKMIDEGNEQALLLLSALSYQTAKGISSLAAVLYGEVDRIILTGGIAYSARIVRDITARVKFIAPVVVIPGEEELEALAAGARRVLHGEEPARMYVKDLPL